MVVLNIYNKDKDGYKTAALKPSTIEGDLFKEIAHFKSLPNLSKGNKVFLKKQDKFFIIHEVVDVINAEGQYEYTFVLGYI
jgi:hypothetical protein